MDTLTAAPTAAPITPSAPATATATVPAPKPRRGRPPTGAAKTAAERQRAYRERQRAAKPQRPALPKSRIIDLTALAPWRRG